MRVVTFIRRNGATCPLSSNIFAMDQTHTIVSQRAAKIVLLLLAGLSVLSFAVAGVAVSSIRRSTLQEEGAQLALARRKRARPAPSARLYRYALRITADCYRLVGSKAD